MRWFASQRGKWVCSTHPTSPLYGSKMKHGVVWGCGRAVHSSGDTAKGWTVGWVPNCRHKPPAGSPPTRDKPIDFRSPHLMPQCGKGCSFFFDALIQFVFENVVREGVLRKQYSVQCKQQTDAAIINLLNCRLPVSIIYLNQQ